MVNVAVDWYTNLHTFNNGGHGSSLKSKVSKTGKACITFRNLLMMFVNLERRNDDLYKLEFLISTLLTFMEIS